MGVAKNLIQGFFYFGLPHGGSDSMTIEVGAGKKWEYAIVNLPSEALPYFAIVFTKSDGTIWHVFGCSELTIVGAKEA